MKKDDAPLRNKKIDLDKGVRGTCEFCGKNYWLLPDSMEVAHDFPTCLEYDAMDPLEFAIANRKRKEKKVAQA